MDKYILGQSKSCTITEIKPECRLDLCLKDNDLYNLSTVYGNIRDYCCNPISNAQIKIYNKCNILLGETYSFNDGSYYFYGIKKFSYIKLIVSKKDYNTFNSGLFKICNIYFRLNIKLNKDYSIDRNKIISGHIVNHNNKPVCFIPVQLFKYYCNNSKNLYKTTLTNEYGQFVFSGNFFGKYEINISLENNEQINEIFFIKNRNKIINLNFKILPNKEAKISGNVLDTNGNNIPYAEVILYRIESNNDLKAIDYTICDENGKYYFDSLPYYKYLVKAKSDSK